MLSFASWADVQINVIPHRGRRHHRVLRVSAGQLLKAVVELFVDDGMFFNPANLIFRGADFDVAASVLNHLKRLAVQYFGHTIRDRRDAVMQIRLPRRNVHLVRLRLGVKVKPPAAANRDEQAQRRPRRRANAGAFHWRHGKCRRRRKHNRGRTELRIAGDDGSGQLSVIRIQLRSVAKITSPGCEGN